MRLVQHEEVVEAFATDGPDDSLHERILPGRAGGGQNLVDPHARDASREGFPVDPISIPKQILGSRIIRERLDELLGCPDCRGMVGDVTRFSMATAADPTSMARRNVHRPITNIMGLLASGVASGQRLYRIGGGEGSSDETRRSFRPGQVVRRFDAVRPGL